MNDKIKVTLNMSRKSAQTIEQLVDITDCPDTSAVFREALRLYRALALAHKEGGEFFIRQNGVETLITLFEDVEYSHTEV